MTGITVGYGVGVRLGVGEGLRTNFLNAGLMPGEKMPISKPMMITAINKTAIRDEEFLFFGVFFARAVIKDGKSLSIPSV